MSAPEELNRLELIGIGTAFRDLLSERLAESVMFSDMPWADLNALAGYMQGYGAASGTEIFLEGEPGDYLCFLISGEVDLFKDSLHGERRLLCSIPPGRTFGEMALIDGERRSATCVARGETRVAILSRHNFEKLLDDAPLLGIRLLRKLSRLLSQRLRGTSGQLVDFLG